MRLNKKLVIGNWKMNGNADLIAAYRASFFPFCDQLAAIDVVLSPPFTLLQSMAEELEQLPIMLGAQNVSEYEHGAHTGEISAAMLASMATKMVIIGHSERRAERGESDRIIAAKVTQATQAGITPVLCVGETAAEKAAGRSEEVVWAQINTVLQEAGMNAFTQIVIAYEPVWAIGSGATASLEDITHMAEIINTRLSALDVKLPLLYGGSVKAKNAADIVSIPAVDGLLVGGASLDPVEFLALCRNSLP